MRDQRLTVRINPTIVIQPWIWGDDSRVITLKVSDLFTIILEKMAHLQGVGLVLETIAGTTVTQAPSQGVAKCGETF